MARRGAASRKAGKGKKAMKSGKRGTRKGTPWTAFVKKIHMELKRKNPGASLGDAMKAASKRKSEM